MFRRHRCTEDTGQCINAHAEGNWWVEHWLCSCGRTFTVQVPF